MYTSFTATIHVRNWQTNGPRATPVISIGAFTDRYIMLAICKCKWQLMLRSFRLSGRASHYKLNSFKAGVVWLVTLWYTASYKRWFPWGLQGINRNKLRVKLNGNNTIWTLSTNQVTVLRHGSGYAQGRILSTPRSVSGVCGRRHQRTFTNERLFEAADGSVRLFIMQPAHYFHASSLYPPKRATNAVPMFNNMTLMLQSAIKQRQVSGEDAGTPRRIQCSQSL